MKIRFPKDYCRYYLDDDRSLKHIGNVLTRKLAGGRVRGITCGYCYARYYYWNADRIEQCPVCRNPTFRKRNKIDLRLSNVV